MPHLTWDSKIPPKPVAAELKLDSIIYPGGNGYPELILGDNLAVMSALLPDYEGQIDLIYADPPFFTNKRYPVRVGRDEDSRRPQEWELADGYPDHWPNVEAYLDMLYPRLAIMHRLLATHGTLYLHLDWHADHYARLLLDEIFGPDRLLNEIIWVYHGPSPIRSAFNRKHDTILAYTKSKEYTFNVDAVREPYNPKTIKTFASSPKAGFGKVPDLERGKVPEDWWYFPVVARLHNERTGYPTQKPQALLERIILASSNPGDLVADFFCGAGTTSLVASQHQRRFIANDLSWRAVHTSRTRHIAGSDTPFKMLNEINLRPERLSGGSNVVKLVGSQLEIEPDLVDNLDYWEVDLDWGGEVFRSAAQAVRPRKKEPISGELALPEPIGEKQIAVRLVNIDGIQTQIVYPG
jgi:DNA modification methylase